MPDYSMCQDSECPIRSDCARYLMVPSNWQSKFMESPREGDSCEYHFSAAKAPFEIRSIEDVEGTVSDA